MEAVTKHCACEEGTTSEDMRYTVESVRCIGACGLAPVMTVDGEVYERVKPSQVAEILDQYE
jgi:NADH-quinone oxidoreductase subunit E